MRKLKPREIIIGIGITTVITSSIFLFLFELYIDDIYNFITSINKSKFKEYIDKIIKIYMLFGFITLCFGIGIILIKDNFLIQKNRGNNHGNSD